MKKKLVNTAAYYAVAGLFAGASTESSLSTWDIKA